MSDDQGRAGVVAEAVKGAVAEIARAENSGEQLAMFEVPTRHTGARAEQLQAAIAHKRQAGRPPGAVNKSTAAFREWLLARGINPLQSMMQWALHTPTSLAAELGCSRLEAFDRLVTLYGELAPYFAAKVAPTDDQGRAVPLFQMFLGGLGGAIAGGDVPPWLRGEIVENQQLGAPQDPASHGAPSHGRAK